jgi:DNA-binding SARP family transcriptional activator
MRWHHEARRQQVPRSDQAGRAPLMRRSALTHRTGTSVSRSAFRSPGRSPRRTAEPPTALQVLGAPRLHSAGVWWDLPPARWVALLAYLARSGGWVRREALAALFWPEHDDHGASVNLRQTLQTIVRSPAGEALVREPTRVRWAGRCDAEAFDALVRNQDWEAAVRSYGGTFLDGVEVAEVPPVQDWIEAERVGLQDRWRTCGLVVARSRLEAERALEAVAVAERLHGQDPFDEAALRLLLRALVASGDRRRAERVFASARAELERELGVDPEGETLRLAAELGLDGGRS